MYGIIYTNNGAEWFPYVYDKTGEMVRFPTVEQADREAELREIEEGAEVGSKYRVISLEAIPT